MATNAHGSPHEINLALRGESLPKVSAWARASRRWATLRVCKGARAAARAERRGGPTTAGVLLTTSGVPRCWWLQHRGAANSGASSFGPARLLHGDPAHPSAALYHHFRSVSTTPTSARAQPRQASRSGRPLPNPGVKSSVTRADATETSMAMWWPLRSIRWPPTADARPPAGPGAGGPGRGLRARSAAGHAVAGVCNLRRSAPSSPGCPQGLAHTPMERWPARRFQNGLRGGVLGNQVQVGYRAPSPQRVCPATWPTSRRHRAVGVVVGVDEGSGSNLRALQAAYGA